MAGNEIEREEVDRLVKELETKKWTRPPVAPRPVVQPVGAQVDPAPTAAAVTTEHQPNMPGRPWSNATLHMPEIASRPQRRTLALASAFGSISHSLPRFHVPAMAEWHWDLITARMFVGLGLALSSALMFWPYANTCGMGLWLYLAAVLLVIITGVWGAKLTWDLELGAAHTLALCTIFWGLVLVAAEVLPRVGYAQVQQPWFCA